GQERDNLGIDSRTAFHWIPESFKVFLDLGPKTAAQRTFAHIQKEGRASQAAASVDEVYENTRRRVESERKRYLSLYNIDITDKTRHDLVVDTGVNNLEEVIEIVVRAFKKWLNTPGLK
ncbi:MAG: hypothetical protein AAB686_02780, partial [Patescibacteria group bacterium]